MHIDIFHLTRESNPKHIHEDTVFENNESIFSQYVKETREAEVEEAITELADNLKDACTISTEDSGTYITIDTTKLVPLFEKHYEEFNKYVSKLSKIQLAEFTSANPELVSVPLHDMREVFDFDYCYILDDYGNAEPVASWMRELITVAPRSVIKYKIEAVYDGKL